MAKKIGLLLPALCCTLGLCTVTAFAASESNNTSVSPTAERQTLMSSVLFRQNRVDVQQSTDDGKSWEIYSPTDETEYFTYEEFSEWLETETKHIQELVDAGEWTQAEASETIANYRAILNDIANGQMVSKRNNSSQDQLFFSLPNMEHPETYQTFLYDGNEFKAFGPYDTEEDLYNAIKEYTETQVSKGGMLPAEADALLEKYE